MFKPGERVIFHYDGRPPHSSFMARLDGRTGVILGGTIQISGYRTDYIVTFDRDGQSESWWCREDALRPAKRYIIRVKRKEHI